MKQQEPCNDCGKTHPFFECDKPKPMTNEERIKADAEAHCGKYHDINDLEYSGYIAGATAENDRAQVLVDALEAIERRIKVGKAGASYQIEMIRPVVMKALEQWKSGKGKEVGDE